MQNKPDWMACTQYWNILANGITVFYKFADHLEVYNTKWIANANIWASLALSAANQKEIDSIIQDKACIQGHISAPVHHPQPLAVLEGFCASPSQEGNSEEGTSPQLEDPGPSAGPSTVAGPSQSQPMTSTTLFRQHFGVRTTHIPTLSKPKRICHCMKCGLEECGGRGGVKWC
ncbi:hypothetical protein FRB91_010869 [Serendipita sp. 411]|nr:hypothetical protein FRC18_005386 [Serendipita sp. 400]KAG8848374.1 hypothetical protein FRB91_010869 [Serendipita sp. 411]